MATSKPDRNSDTAINEMLPDNLISEDEKIILAIKPSLWMIAFFSFRTVAIAAVVAVILTLSSPRLHLGRWAGYAIQFCALAAIVRLAFALLQWASRTYVLTDKRIISIRGVFTIDIFQCSLPKIQNTFLVLTLPQRILSLGSIALTTAGTGQVEAVWQHLKHPLNIHQKILQTLNPSTDKTKSQQL